MEEKQKDEFQQFDFYGAGIVTIGVMSLLVFEDHKHFIIQSFIFLN
jgi:hypothetical protein